MSLKLKIRTQFPALVSVNSPITLVKTGLQYTFGFDTSNISTLLDPTLQALAALDSTAGLLTQIAVDGFTKRVLTGTANEITITNGDGVAGAPTWSLPAALTFTGKTVTGGTFSGIAINGATLLTSTYNKVTITAPATSATLTLVDGTTLTGPAASGTAMTLGNVETIIGAKTFGAAGNVGKLAVAGTTSGSTILNATAIASGTLTLPAATDTLTGKATADILTNKTIDTAGTGNHIQISGVDITRGQILGEASTAAATAGNIGEYIESVIAVGSATALTTNVAKNVTSISLTAGDWDVAGNIGFVLASTTNITFIEASISQTTGAVDATNGRAAAMSMAAFVPTAGTDFILPIQPVRLSLSGTTTVFLVALSTFTVAGNSAFGIIRARRVR